MNLPQKQYLDSLSKSISLNNFRELLDCIEFDKLIRFEIFFRYLNKLEYHIEQLGLNFEISDKSFKVLIDESMDDWSSTFESCDDKDLNAMRFVYIHKSKKICEIAKLQEARNDDFEFGKLLKYPKCCVNAYLIWQKSNEDIDPITSITNSNPYAGKLQNYNFPNPFSRYFGAGLYSHFPCSVKCKETIWGANESFKKLQANFPAIANGIFQFEKAFVIFHKTKGVCLGKNSM